MPTRIKRRVNRGARSRLQEPECRAVPASFTVTTLQDVNVLLDGDGNEIGLGLRGAINRANTTAGLDTITFAQSGTISLNQQIPDITDTLTINGRSGSNN